MECITLEKGYLLLSEIDKDRRASKTYNVECYKEGTWVKMNIKQSKIDKDEAH